MVYEPTECARRCSSFTDCFAESANSAASVGGLVMPFFGLAIVIIIACACVAALWCYFFPPSKEAS